jgi:hypothetical protein
MARKQRRSGRGGLAPQHRDRLAAAWRGDACRGLRERKETVIKARDERLKEGVRITSKEVHVIHPSEVGRDRAALKFAGAPSHAPMQRVKGHWNVALAPFIAARKADGRSGSP